MLMIFFAESLELTEKNALFMIAGLVGARSLARMLKNQNSIFFPKKKR